MSYWRTAGLSYLQYITVASSALRNTVKPQLQNKIWPREDISFRKQVWDRASGKPGEKSMYMLLYYII